MKLSHQKLCKLAAAGLVLAGLVACGGGGGGGNTPAAGPTTTGTTTDTSTGGTSSGTTTGGTTTVGTTTGGTTTTGTVTTGTTTVATTTTGTVTGGSTVSTGTTTATPLTALQIATAYLASYDAARAIALPATGALQAATYDACYLSSGRTKANSISNYDADFALNPAAGAFRIGSTRTNPVILAERNTTNTDGSARREIDVQYKVNFVDGSADNVTSITLITGSSFGSCATPQNSTDVRQFGDRQLVGLEIRAETTRFNQFELYQKTLTGVVSPPGAPVVQGVTTIPAGQPKSVPVTYERVAQFRIQDPMGNATYAVVTGPGFRTVSGVLTPWSVKMLSPRLLKSDPLLAGKTGNFTSLNEDSTFSFCRLANGNLPGTAALADCANGGARNSRYGVFMGLPASTLVPTEQAEAFDASWATIGIVTGTYTFKIYNDDGWKTIDGQAGKTPIKTYTAQLESLPISFVDMYVTSNPDNDKFPKISSPSSPAAGAASITAGLAYTASIGWTPPLFVATNPFKVAFVEGYAEGTIATTGLGWPRVASFTDIYPGNNVTTGTINVQANPANLGYKTYAEVQVNYTNRNGTRIKSIVSFN